MDYDESYKNMYHDRCENFCKTKNIHLKIDEDLEKYLMVRRERNFGIQYVFAFNNNLGVSVVKTPCTYGNEFDLWEVAILQYLENLYKYELFYSELTNFDTLGYLDDKQVNKFLGCVKNNRLNEKFKNIK